MANMIDFDTIIDVRTSIIQFGVLIGLVISEPDEMLVFRLNLNVEGGIADEEKTIQCGADDWGVEAGTGRSMALMNAMVP